MSEDAMREAIARRLADYDALYPLTDAEWEAMRDVGAGDYFGQADAVLAVVRGVDADEAKALLRDAGRFMFHRDMCRWPEVCTCGLAEWREQLALYRRVVPVGTWSRDE